MPRETKLVERDLVRRAVIDSFVKQVGPKGREYVDAVLAAGK